MSSIGPGIAGSVSQSSMQQGQVARARDKQTNARARHAQQLEEQFEHHVSEVEDSGETDDDRLRIRDEDRDQQQRRREQEARDASETAPADEPATEQPPGQHIDLEA